MESRSLLWWTGKDSFWHKCTSHYFIQWTVLWILAHWREIYHLSSKHLWCHKVPPTKCWCNRFCSHHKPKYWKGGPASQQTYCPSLKYIFRNALFMLIVPSRQHIISFPLWVWLLLCLLILRLFCYIDGSHYYAFFVLYLKSIPENWENKLRSLMSIFLHFIQYYSVIWLFSYGNICLLLLVF